MLTAFTAGLLLITVSELGDKTFFVSERLLSAIGGLLFLVFAVVAIWEGA
nr:hypothetical protein [Chroococcidiopsis sp. TS-821]